MDNRKTGGFASMSPERRREIASKGGKACHENGNAYHWTHATAQEAGRKGGTKSRRGKRTVTDAQVEALRTRIAQQMEGGE
jgi:general stress protein YciG